MTSIPPAPAARGPRMILLGAYVVAVVARFKQRARAFYHEVMLSGHACPRCDGRLAMLENGRCRCGDCGVTFDPTIAFQRCPACDGTPRIRIRRYECRRCHTKIVSRFCFDGVVFDAEYFRHKMAESRKRKQERHERILAQLTEIRSPVLPPGPADPTGAAGLWDVLNALTAGATEQLTFEARDRFDLRRYQAHVQAHVGTISGDLEQIPPLSENTRLDRIWRFIAIIFLAHAGALHVWQEGTTIWVKAIEADGEGQAVSWRA